MVTGDQIGVLGARLCAAVMVLSGGLKVLEPGNATLFLGQLLEPHLTFVTARLVVHAFSCGQVALGVVILADPRGRLARGCGFWLVAALLAGKVATWVAGKGAECGCFGSYSIPDWLVIAVTGVGLISLRIISPRKVPRRQGWTVVTCATLLPLAAVAIIDGGRVLTTANGRQLEVLAGLNVDEDTVVVVGSGACPDCCELLRQHEQELRLFDRVVFIARAGKQGEGCLATRRRWLEVVAVDEQAWWSMIDTTPPTLLWKKSNGALERIHSLSEAVSSQSLIR